MKKIRKNTQKGFSLIELILVLGISSLAFIGFLQMERQRAEVARAEMSGAQIKEVGDALEIYIHRNAGALTLAIPINTTSPNLPLTILQGAAFGTFPGTHILPTTFVNNNIIGGPYQIRIRNENNNLIGLVVTTRPIADLSSVRYDWAGIAMREAGPGAGTAFLVNNVITGFDGAWNFNNTQFPNITTAGQLAYRAQALNSATFDNVYLRLDGAFPMRGDLNMGNFNINNVTNINANGFINANNINANTIASGAINNAGNITNLGRIDSTGNIISRRSVETNFVNRDNLLGNRDVTVGDGTASPLNQGNIRVRDVFIRGGSGARPAVAGGGGAWLSDLLPRFSSRGAVVVQDGWTVPKPNCPIGGTAAARIHVIPQVHIVQGRVLGTFTGPAGSPWSSHNFYSTGALIVWATDLGWGWQTHLRTPEYGGGQGVMGLAHIYCDNQF